MSAQFPTLAEYKAAQGYTDGGIDDESGDQQWRMDDSWTYGGDGDYSRTAITPEQQAVIDKYQMYDGTKYADLMSQLSGDSELAKYVGGTSGYLKPQGQGAWGMGGGRSTGMSLSDLFSQYSDDNDGTSRMSFDYANASPEEQALRFSPEQVAARAEFEKLYPGMAQVTPDVLQKGANGWGLKPAGPSAGYYLENPNDIKYDPKYGLITSEDNQGVAGSKGGSGSVVKAIAPMALAALAPYAIPALGGGTLGGALYGAGSSALMGGDPLRGAIMGGIGGYMSGGSVDADIQGYENFYGEPVAFGEGAGGQLGDLRKLYNSPEVQGLKDAYGMYKTGSNILGSLFSNNSIPSYTGGGVQASSQVAPAVPVAQPQIGGEGLNNLYSSNYNLDPYGLNYRRRSWGR